MPPPTQPDAIIQQIEALLRARRMAEAGQLSRTLTAQHPDRFDVWLIGARVRQHAGDLPGMLDHAQRAVSLNPGHIGAKLLLAEALLQNGQSAKALKHLSRLEKKAKRDPRLLQALGELYTHAGHHINAQRCYKQAYRLQPDDPRIGYNLATAAIALGQMDEAEALLDSVIAKTPDDYDAYYNRATLRKQTPDNNHVAQIQTALETQSAKHPAAQVQLCYALAKEREDLGDHAASFAALKQGADARRTMLAYNVESDVATIDRIIETFAADVVTQPGTGFTDVNHVDSGPIFVMGLPRSGTTLVDRILSAHSQVDSLGEINDLALALTRLAGEVASKDDLVARAAQIDFAALGQAYADSTAGRGVNAPHLIDKTPANYLYLGLIALALPNAKIIHLRRHPMDSAYAMYKTLFRMGYPFSYSLEDLGQYMVAYRRLMDHWRRVLPGRFLDADYEALVADQETVSRQIVAHCGLGWEDACLSFHENKGAAATASAAQVRQPIYTTSSGLWRRYEGELAPLAQFFTQNGVDIS